ncbi:MAG: acetolactate synthase large subunit, partial [Bifidobacterium pseudolongum subsp. globosum]|nr:acetolactate synthase large subunit [Bifidobacterium pseudolongum subsp. globosum]
GQIRKAAEAIMAAKKPVMMVGGGSQVAADEVNAFAAATGIPVITTLMGIGAFPAGSDQALGMPGMHGTVTANRAITNSDLIIGAGLRFDDRVTGKISRFAPNATIVHIDIDPAEISKLVKAHVPVVGDLRDVLPRLQAELEPLQVDDWWTTLKDWRDRYPERYKTDKPLVSQEVIEMLQQATGGDCIVTTEVGQHQMFAARMFPTNKPRSFITSGGLGTMGFGLPAAIGAEIGSQQYFDGKKPVWLIDGDGSFQMTSEELATAFMEGTPIKIALLNNSVYGMVRQWQTLFYEKHYSATILHEEEKTGLVGVPDFVKLAEAYGCVGLRARTKEEAIECIRKANEINDRPVLIDFHVWKDAMVWPMIAAGDANDNVTYMPGIKPLLNPQGNVSLQDEPDTTEENN